MADETSTLIVDVPVPQEVYDILLERDDLRESQAGGVRWISFMPVIDSKRPVNLMFRVGSSDALIIMNSGAGEAIAMGTVKYDEQGR